MPSSKGYLEFIQDQLSGLEGVSWKAMKGEYILYHEGKVVGGIYDDRLLVKPTVSATAMLPDAPSELPYEGAKPMLLVEDAEDRELLQRLVESVGADLPAPKKKR